MDILDQALAKFDLFWLIAFRISGIFYAAPIFGTRYVPAQWKIGFSLLLSLIVLPLAPAPPGGIPQELFPWLTIAVKELGIGLLIGFISNLLFIAVQTGGQLLDLEMGFGITNVLDPQSGTSIPMIGNFQYLLAMLVFLSLNGHHFLIAALVRSLQTIPAGGSTLSGPLYEAVLGSFSNMFLTAVKLSAPVMGALFLTNVALGFMARTVPQMNVFMVGMPAKVIIGILVIAAGLPMYLMAIERLSSGLFRDILGIIQRLKP